MDPTKSFDHLDPTLKETYARVMGNIPGGDTQTPPYQPTPAATPTAPSPQTPIGPNQQPYTAAPTNQAFNPTPQEGPNPGTGPAINSMPTDTTTMVAPPAEATTPTEPAPPTSSFFSNPSPAATEPPQMNTNNNLSTPFTPATEPSQVPITPYSADTPASAAVPVDQMSQPLPSPSSIAQSAPHQTSALLKVLYIVAAAVFFAIYTVFWIKVFNLPFLF